MKTNKLLLVVVVLTVVSLACQKSIAPFPETYVSAREQVGQVTDPLSSAIPEVSGDIDTAGNSVADFIAHYPELYAWVAGHEEDTVVFVQVLQSGTPLIMALTLDDLIPGWGQTGGLATDAVLIIGIMVAGVVVYTHPEIAEVLNPARRMPDLNDLFQPEILISGLAVLAASSDWVQIDPSSIGFQPPDVPNGFCGLMQQITGHPCRWELLKSFYHDGTPMYKLVLKTGDWLIAEFETMEAPLVIFEELHPVLVNGMWQGLSKGFLTYIGVAKVARLCGLGRMMWEAGDRLIKNLNPQAINIFADAAGWGEALMSKLPETVTIVEITASKIWLYIVP